MKLILIFILLSKTFMTMKSPCMINEFYNVGGARRCENDDQCQGDRQCNLMGFCFGKSNCNPERKLGELY